MLGKTKMNKLVISLLVLFFAVGIIFYITIIQPEMIRKNEERVLLESKSKYEEAVRYYKIGKFEDASLFLQDIENFNDSENLLTLIDLAKSVKSYSLVNPGTPFPDVGKKKSDLIIGNLVKLGDFLNAKELIEIQKSNYVNYYFEGKRRISTPKDYSELYQLMIGSSPQHLEYGLDDVYKHIENYKMWAGVWKLSGKTGQPHYFELDKGEKHDYLTISRIYLNGRQHCRISDSKTTLDCYEPDSDLLGNWRVFVNSNERYKISYEIDEFKNRVYYKYTVEEDYELKGDTLTLSFSYTIFNDVYKGTRTYKRVGDSIGNQ
jgi:hypothetical protein